MLCLMPYRNSMSSMQAMQRSSRAAAGLVQQRVNEKIPPNEPCDGQADLALFARDCRLDAVKLSLVPVQCRARDQHTRDLLRYGHNILTG